MSTGTITELIELFMRLVNAKKVLREKILQDIDSKYKQLRDITDVLFATHRDIQKAIQALNVAVADKKNTLSDEVNTFHSALSNAMDGRAGRRAGLLALREEVVLLAKRFDNPSDEILKPLNEMQITAVKHFMQACAFYFEISSHEISFFEHKMYGLLTQIQSELDHLLRHPDDNKEDARRWAEGLDSFLSEIEKGIDEKWNLVAGAYAFVRLTIQ